MARDLGWRLFVAMFKEELRLQKSFIGTIASGFFPVMIFIFSVVLAVSFSLLHRIDTSLVLLMVHIGFMLYGLGVGALSFIGEQVMTRRLGQANMLLQLSQYQPITFKRTMAVFYLKDALFYILYSIIPLVGGIAIAAPIAHISFASVGLLALTVFLTFMLGMSLSFLISAISVRSRVGVIAVGLVLLAVLLSVWPLGLLPPGYVIVPLGFWTAKNTAFLLFSAVLVVVFSLAAVAFSKERFEAPQRSYSSVFLPTEAEFSFAGRSRTLVAKEWIELKRSGTLSAVVLEYLAPLLAIYLLAWIFRTGMGVPIQFNTIFYGGMVGFLGVMVYSWLTNLEPNEFMNAQPATVDQVIRAKLVLYFMLTTFASFSYVIAIGVLNGEFTLLPLALLVALATTTYVAGVITRLTGIWTNTMLFDARVLAKFAGAVVPPLIIVMIASFMIGGTPWIAATLLLAESAVLLFASRPLLRGMSARWGKEHFSFAKTDTGGG